VTDDALAAPHAEVEAFVRRAAPRLLRVAHALTGRSADAEDIVQEALARVCAAWPRLRSDGNLDAYARRTLVNLFLNEQRRRRNERRVVVLLGAMPPPEPAPSAALTDALHLLDALPPKQRAAVALRYVADLDDQAIAHALACSPATVRSQISRALESLRRLDGVKGSVDS